MLDDISDLINAFEEANTEKLFDPNNPETIRVQHPTTEMSPTKPNVGLQPRGTGTTSFFA